MLFFHGGRSHDVVVECMQRLSGGEDDPNNEEWSEVNEKSSATGATPEAR